MKPLGRAAPRYFSSPHSGRRHFKQTGSDPKAQHMFFETWLWPGGETFDTSRSILFVVQTSLSTMKNSSHDEERMIRRGYTVP
ncbi:MAG TPA: hypothetical protein VF516_33755 [Kofleriaceae bacterium]